MARPIGRQPRAVALAPALAHRIIVDGERPLRQRQAGAARLGLGDHGAQVLADEIDVEGQRTGVLAVERRRDGGSAVLEHVGPARGVGQEFHQPLVVEVQVAAQHVGLGQRLVVDHQRQVERELHAGAGAHGPHVLDAPAHLVEQRLGLGEVLLAAAGDAQQLALPRRTHRAAHRALDEDAALGAHLLGQRHLVVRLHRAHLDEQLALDVAGEQPVGLLVDGGQRLLVGEDGDDRLGLRRQLGRGLGHLGACVRQRLGLVRRAVPHRHVVADLDQMGRNRRAHAAHTRNADTHVAPPGILCQQLEWRSLSRRLGTN